MEAEYRALEYGQAGSPVQWRGKMGRHGDVVAGTQYRINDYNCRDYTHTIYIDGRPQVARGTACRQADGRWQAVGVGGRQSMAVTTDLLKGQYG
jgi:surface antigen